MYSTNIWPESEVRGSGSYIYGIYHNSHGSYDIYYGDITLGCKADNVTIKTTYNNVLYLFSQLVNFVCFGTGWFEGNHGIACDRWIHILASDTPKRWVCTSITMLLELLGYKVWYLWDICGLFVTTKGGCGLWKRIVGLL